MYQRIIVPIEDGATRSLEQGRALARELGCELTLLHMHHTQEAPTELEGLPQFRFQGVVESWDGLDMEEEAQEVKWLADMARALAEEEAALTVSSRVVHAPLAQTLRVEEESALVLVSADDIHVDGLNRTAQELVRAGGLPVLVTRSDMSVLPVHRILITLDGSVFSEEIMAPALELARVTGARISLLEVVTRRGGLRQMFRPSDRSAELAERSLREVRGRIPEDHGMVDVRVVEQGNPAAGIVLETRREEVDVVAMATHGRGGFRRLVLGSVAESVIRGGQVPVLLYRPVGSTAARGPSTQAAESTA